MNRPPSSSPFGVRATAWIAAGFGLGWSPVASGTVGSLPGLLLVALVWPRLPGAGAQALLALVLAGLAVPLCHVAERHFGRKDDGRIVADEYLCFPLAFIGLPVTGSHAWMLACGFVVCRAMDILKPPPANGLQSLRGGLGIVADDFFASLYALAVNHLLYRAVTAWLL